MIRKSVKRFSEKIMRKSKAQVNSNAMPGSPFSIARL
jgi:hypothetical protein